MAATNTDTEGLAIVERGPGTDSYLPDFGSVPFSQVHIQFGNSPSKWS